MTDPCPICRGTGYFVLDVPITDINFGNLITCECLLEEKTERAEHKRLMVSGLKELDYLTFETFEPRQKNEYALMVAHLYSRQPTNFLVLAGFSGTGKTHLAVAIGNELFQHNFDVIYRSVPDLVDSLRTLMWKDDFPHYHEQITMLRTIHILILDDFGTERATPWSNEVLFHLLDYRSMLQQPTILCITGDPMRLDPMFYSFILDTVHTHRILLAARPYYEPEESAESA